MKIEIESKKRTKAQRVGVGVVGAAMLFNLTGCIPPIPNPGPKGDKLSEYSENSDYAAEISKEVCDCCDYSTGGYTYHTDFDPQNVRIEKGDLLTNGIFKPDSHNLKDKDLVSLYIGKNGIEAEEKGGFWRMRCNDEMPQILNGEKDYWQTIIVVLDTLNERELKQLEDGELSFLIENNNKNKVVVSTLEDLDETLEPLK